MPASVKTPGIVAASTTTAITGLSTSSAARNPARVSADWTTPTALVKACPGPDMPTRWATIEPVKEGGILQPAQSGETADRPEQLGGGDPARWPGPIARSGTGPR